MRRAEVRRLSVEGFDAYAVENPQLCAVVVPALGGRVWTVEDRRRERQWIWHRDDVPLAVSPLGAPYDDVWAGGWEELFPNDAPGSFEGRDLPDHGEWWTMSWEPVETASGDRALLSMRATSTCLRASCFKSVYLDADGAALRVRYRISSEEALPFHFLFKQHLAIHITSACQLVVPGGVVEPVDPAFGSFLRRPERFRWPVTTDEGSRVDLGVVHPRSSRTREFLYVRDLPEPWCGVTDLERSAWLRLEWDAQHLPYLWLFLSYGGWRNTYTAVLEPCTNLPKDLATAEHLGQCARLEPGHDFSTEVVLTLGGGTECRP